MVQLIPLILFCFSSSFTPGPNNLMIMNSGLNFGIKKSIPHYLGISFGFSAMLLIVALGFSSLFTKYSWIQELLKVFGIAYMLYLAWKIANSNNKTTSNAIQKPITFIQAVLFQWINPKAWTMGVGAISIFSISTLSPLNNAFLITFIFLITVLFSVMTWLLCGHALQNILKNEKHKRIFNYTMAIILVLSIALIFFE